MKSLLILLLNVLIITTAGLAQKTSRIIEQPQSPIKIMNYNADFQKGSKYQSEGILHELEYKNITQKNIIAVQLGLVAFDVWNEFLDRTGGVSMEELKPNDTRESSWIARRYGDFSFYSGIAYVSKVRFDNGEIWEANLEDIAKELKKIEKDFDISNLTKKDTENK